MYICPGDSIPPPNEKSILLKGILKRLMFVQIIVGLMKFLFNPFIGIIDLLTAFQMNFTYNQLSYCNSVTFVILQLINIFIIVLSFGKAIQNLDPILDASFIVIYKFWVQAFSMVFYIVSINFGFEAYKEFKGISYDTLIASFNEIEILKGNQMLEDSFEEYNSQKEEFN